MDDLSSFSGSDNEGFEEELIAPLPAPVPVPVPAPAETTKRQTAAVHEVETPKPRAPSRERSVPAADSYIICLGGVDRTVTPQHVRAIVEHFGVQLVGEPQRCVDTLGVPLEEMDLEFGSAEEVQRIRVHLDGGFVNGRKVRLSVK